MMFRNKSLQTNSPQDGTFSTIQKKVLAQKRRVRNKVSKTRL